MTSKGIRKLRVVEQAEQPTAAEEAPVVEEVTLEQLQAANKAIEVQIRALGADLTGYNDVLTEIIFETLIGMLIENGLIDREQFLLRKEARLNVKLSDVFGQVQQEALLRQRAEMRRQADLEVAKGPGVWTPKRLHG